MERFIVVKGWMIDVLGLTGCDLLCYATIYGFSQPNKKNQTVGEWNGTIPELASWVGCSQSQVKRAIDDLLSKNLIEITHEIVRNGGGKTKCFVATDGSKWTGCKKIAVSKWTVQPVQNEPSSQSKMNRPDPCPYYNNINNIHKAGVGENQPIFSTASKPSNKPSEDSQPFAGEVEIHDVSKSNKQDRKAYAEASEVAKELARVYGNERAATKMVVSRVKVLLEKYTRFELIAAIKNAMEDGERKKFQLKSLLGDDMVASLVRDANKKPSDDFYRRTL